MTELHICASTADTLDALKKLTSWATEVYLAYAWASSDGGNAAHWKLLSTVKVKRAVIGIQFASTEPMILRRFARLGGDVLRVVEDVNGVFHPKCIAGIRDDEAAALFGSSNFTNGGFAGNTELNVYVRGPKDEAPLCDLLGFIEEHWGHPRSCSPDEEWFGRYEDAYKKRARPTPLLRPRRRVSRPVSEASDLDVGWSAFVELISGQERRALANGYQIHVFDHPEGSYLEMIEHCQQTFARYDSLDLMPLDERSYVAGFAPESGYFGSTRAAGNFKHIINKSPQVLSAALDRVHLSGTVSEQTVRTFLESACKIPGVALATATRLLVVKRPDLFFSPNSANRERLQAVFGIAPTREPGYLDLLGRIWQMPWFTAREPDDRTERRIWKARVALIDAILYDVS
jgi:HKD family nuclease